MEKSALLAISLLMSTSALAESLEDTATTKKPIEHVKVADVTTLEDAKRILFEETLLLKQKQSLDTQALHDIHMITYRLEKSIAFFTEHLNGESQQLAKTLAEVVEEIHLDSENNRISETEQHLEKYHALTDTFVKHL